MIESIHNLHKTLYSSNIDYCHWKSTDHIHATLLGDTDLDVLISKSQYQKFEDIISRLGFKELKTVHLRSYPGIKDFIFYDSIEDKWIHIHAHYLLNLGDRWVKAFHFPIEEKILSRKIFVENGFYYIIHPMDELLLLKIRMALKFYLPYFRKRVRVEYAFIANNCQFQNQLDGIKTPLTTIHKIDLSTTNNLLLNLYSLRLRKELSFYRRFSKSRFLLFSMLRKFYRYIIEINRRKFKSYEIGRRNISQGGKIIALVGIDGSGKTSSIKFLVEFFKIQFNVTRVFLGYGKSGAGLLRRIIFKLYGTKRKPSTKSDKKISVLYAIWIFLCVLEKRRNLKIAIKARANGKLVFSDRWPQESINNVLDGPRLGDYNGQNLLINWIKNYEKKIIQVAQFIMPDLIIKIVIDEQISLSRKPNELDVSTARLLSNYLNSTNWICEEQIEVDGNLSQEIVLRNLKKVIWAKI
jgi:thymidylate kinase